MTEPALDAAQTAPEGAEGAAEQSGNYTPPATQADLDRIISERVARTKAQFKDYADVKAKAAELDQIRQANQSEAERQAAELTRWQSEAETWRKAAVGNRIEALASVEFADASDAVTALSEGQYLDAGGQINEEQIRADLAALLDRKPHWRRGSTEPAGPRLPAPNRAQGASGQPGSSDPAAQFATFIQSQLQGRG